MSAYLSYQIEVALLLIAFYLCFKCFLSRERMHRVNRIIIILTSVLSFILPMCVITVHKVVSVPSVAEVTAVAAPDSVTSQIEAVTLSWEPFIAIVFWAGVTFVFIRLILSILRVMKLVGSGTKSTLYGSGVIVCDGDIPPFSWMKWIVMSRADFESGNRHILEHEKAHIRLGHSADALLLELVSIPQWFNPAVWLLKRELRAIHEYEADDAVLRSGADIKEYQYSLIRKAVSASGYSITNSFNHSILKNRITMMSKSKATAMRALRALYILPLVCGSLALNARTVTDCKVSENFPVLPETDSAVRVELNHSADGGILYSVDGTDVLSDNVGAAVEARMGGDKSKTVEISAPADVRYGVIKGVAEQLRSVSALKVKYACPGNEGVQKRLPPDGESARKAGLKPVDPLEAARNVPKDRRHQLRINANDKVLYDATPIDAGNLCSLVAESIRANHQSVICIQMNTATSYGAYISAIKDLDEAVNQVRDEYSREHYGKSLVELDDTARAAVLKEIPRTILELDPKTDSAPVN